MDKLVSVLESSRSWMEEGHPREFGQASLRMCVAMVLGMVLGVESGKMAIGYLSSDLCDVPSLQLPHPQRECGRLMLRRARGRHA